MNFFFQKFCNSFPPYKMDTKFKKKFFYFVFSFFKFFISGPFKLDFKNYKFYAFPQKSDYTRYLLTRVSIPDPRERKIIKQNLIGEKNVFIDCGANAGFYSLDVWGEVKNCKIFAFEPSKKERFFLNENIKLNNAKNINVIDFAIGDKKGEVYFNDTRTDDIKNSGGGGFVTKEQLDSYKNYKVNITTIDNYFENRINDIKNSCIFIKIDLEGYDLKAIKGATKTILENDCSVIFEFSKMILDQDDYNKEYLNIFFSNNFKIYNMYGEQLEYRELEEQISRLDNKHHTCGNFFLTKKKLNFNF